MEQQLHAVFAGLMEIRDACDNAMSSDDITINDLVVEIDRIVAECISTIRND